MQQDGLYSKLGIETVKPNIIIIMRGAGKKRRNKTKQQKNAAE